MAWHRRCDGVSRRDFVRAGAVCGGLTLAGYQKLLADGAVNPAAKAKSGIFIYLGGGPTHLDTFDLKPDAPAEYRGEFKPMKTAAPGVEFCELLPKLAAQAKHFAVLRGVSHTLAAHEFGTKYMTTGNRPLPSLEYPGIGSVAAKELASARDIPPYVAVPSTPERPGFLGIAQTAFSTTQAPTPGRPFNVRGIGLANGVTIADLDRREALLDKLDLGFASAESSGDMVGGLDRFGQQAADILRSKKAREAFDVSKEPSAVAQRFGTDPFGQSCLLATRLIESGVRFVTVSHGGWDTHNQNFDAMRKKLPVLDAGLAGLFATLAERGLLDSTAVYMTGEFGRTPKINVRGGRDHYPRAMFCLLGGGGIKGGQVVGASDDKGMGPKSTPITPEQVASSFYKALGIDHTKEYQTSSGRPIMVVRDGAPLKELFS